MRRSVVMRDTTAVIRRLLDGWPVVYTGRVSALSPAESVGGTERSYSRDVRPTTTRCLTKVTLESVQPNTPIIPHKVLPLFLLLLVVVVGGGGGGDSRARLSFSPISNSPRRPFERDCRSATSRPGRRPPRRVTTTRNDVDPTSRQKVHLIESSSY
uniref:Uncharacterized protein n=1 Tax=Plectus sambesii TaxID=2011161 RepID=A0A914WTC8_9BILA